VAGFSLAANIFPDSAFYRYRRKRLQIRVQSVDLPIVQMRESTDYHLATRGKPLEYCPARAGQMTAGMMKTGNDNTSAVK
jgi:hypothetical protein